jgi:alkylhydroperoxidase/carboxymuconolactone decarboxylase family protein YurZ
MDERTKELVAIGALAAVNCYPCLQHRLAERDRLGIDRAEAKAAVEVGMMVNWGAASKTKDHVHALLGADGCQKGSGRGGC